MQDFDSNLFKGLLREDWHCDRKFQAIFSLDLRMLVCAYFNIRKFVWAQRGDDNEVT